MGRGWTLVLYPPSWESQLPFPLESILSSRALSVLSFKFLSWPKSPQGWPCLPPGLCILLLSPHRLRSTTAWSAPSQDFRRTPLYLHTPNPIIFMQLLRFLFPLISMKQLNSPPPQGAAPGSSSSPPTHPVLFSHKHLSSCL